MTSRRAAKMTSSIARHLLAAACLLALPAAQAGEAFAYQAQLQQRLAKEGPRNAVLNQMELGARAFEGGQYPEARSQLDQALAQIESFYSQEEGARQARSLWYEEGRKDFKGEPYERVMAYYYRGLLYLMEQDWGNARASFEAGMLQDAFAEEEQNQFDFALVSYLSAWASQREGNTLLRDKSLAELNTLRPGFAGLEPGHDTLVIVETGTSPRKLGDGVGHYELVYRRGKGFSEERATLTLDGTPLALYPVEDIFWQASSRGGRAVDRIVQGKASFKATNAGAGGVLADTASTLQVLQPLTGSSGGLGAVTGALGAIGSIQMLVASKVNAKADVRYWSSLPDAVHVLSLKSGGARQAQLHFTDRHGQPVAGLDRTLDLPANGGLVWVRARPSSALPPSR